MPATDFAAMRCSIARSFAAMGDPWTALILRDLHLGLTRFDLLVGDLGISRKVLTERLAAMTSDGLVDRVAYQHNPERFDYALTERGRELIPILMAILSWGDRWLGTAEGPPVTILHGDHTCAVALLCSACGQELHADQVGVVAGPGGGPGPGTALIGARLGPVRSAT